MCKYQIVKIMMDWKRLISAKRFGMEEFHEERQENRSEFQRDYDRLVFSAPFRRLQTWFRRKICSSPRRTLFLTEERLVARCASLPSSPRNNTFIGETQIYRYIFSYFTLYSIQIKYSKKKVLIK